MGWRLFGNNSFLDPDDEVWQIELWCWFLERFGGLKDLEYSRLVLPTAEFFPPTDKKNHERAEHIFDCVKKLARMPNWPCRLIAQPERASVRVSESVYLKPVTHSPAGTFGMDGDEVVITYDPAGLREPVDLIATLAHELAHYLLAAYANEAPGGKELHEPATDLLTVYMGFGVFGAISAFQYKTDSTSWGWSRRGYISQRAWLFALAIFTELRGDDSKVLQTHLKPHLYSDLKGAIRYLRQKDLLAKLAPVASLHSVPPL